MGVPSLFRSIVKKYPECYFCVNQDITEHLYLDFNCLIHHCINKLVYKEDSSNRFIEEDLISSVISYTSHIICEVVKPTKLVYIAIDGPVPMGKIYQQRNRRYKKIQDDAFKKKLKQKYNIPVVNTFDSNKVTPGTVFMTKLCNRIKNLISLNAFSLHIHNTNNKFCVFFSDSNTPGEGEHKIMNFIRNNNNSPNIIIYGLDADLIVLSMLCTESKIKLIREPQNTSTEISDFAIDHEFVYISIEAYTDSFIREYNLTAYDRKSIIKDVVFVSFFGGNDFVEPFVNTRIRDKNNYSKLINYYVTILFELQKHLINERSEINIMFFEKLLEKIAENEDQFVKKKVYYSSGHKSSESEKEITYEQELELYYHAPYTSPTNPFYDYYKGKTDTINYKLPHTSWKSQYYNHFCCSTILNDLCKEYIQSLIWTFRYYIDEGIPSWDFRFKARVAPCASDVLKYVQSEKNSVFTCCKFESIRDKTIITPIEQLLMVTPIQNSCILPWSFQFIYEDFTAIRFQLDIMKGGKNIYSEPVLEDINREEIDKLLRNVPVTEIESTRNVVKNKLFCMKF
jgi:5'-3' exonuclease